MTQRIQHFLLVFDHGEGRLLEATPFHEDIDAALAAYAEREEAFEGKSLVEIVLVGSDSLETVKLTHANYFDESVAISKYLVGLQ
jgi:hypothetical protein